MHAYNRDEWKNFILAAKGLYNWSILDILCYSRRQTEKQLYITIFSIEKLFKTLYIFNGFHKIFVHMKNV